MYLVHVETIGRETIFIQLICDDVFCSDQTNTTPSYQSQYLTLFMMGWWESVLLLLKAEEEDAKVEKAKKVWEMRVWSHG